MSGDWSLQRLGLQFDGSCRDLTEFYIYYWSIVYKNRTLYTPTAISSNELMEVSLVVSITVILWGLLGLSAVMVSSNYIVGIIK